MDNTNGSYDKYYLTRLSQIECVLNASTFPVVRTAGLQACEARFFTRSTNTSSA